MKRVLSLAALGAAVIAAAPAFATNIQIAVNYDLTGAVVTSNTIQTINESANLPTVTVHAGDTIDYKINFVGTDKITLNGAINLLEFLKPVSGSSAKVTQTGKLTLLGSDTGSGNVSFTRASNSTRDGTNVGLQFTAAPPYSDFVSPSGPISFTGLEWVGTVSGFSSGTSQQYNLTGFTVSAGSVAVSGVPEPASWALMLGGFGALGATLRRNRKGVAAAI